MGPRVTINRFERINIKIKEVNSVSVAVNTFAINYWVIFVVLVNLFSNNIFILLTFRMELNNSYINNNKLVLVFNKRKFLS